MEASPYPSHIGEQTRIDIAQSLLLHEYKKLFASASPEMVEILKHDINSWLTDGNTYQFAGLRDFWNGVDGMMMGFKLKNIVPLLTAENVIWRKEAVSVATTLFAVDFAPFVQKRQTGAEVTAFLNANPGLHDQAKAASDLHFEKPITRDNDPVIVLENESGEQMVHDGNGRLKRAVLYGKETIPAFVGKKTGETLQNYWVPTGLLMQLVALAKSGQEEAAATALCQLFQVSDSALYEFSERAIAKDHPFRQVVLWQNERNRLS